MAFGSADTQRSVQPEYQYKFCYFCGLRQCRASIVYCPPTYTSFLTKCGSKWFRGILLKNVKIYQLTFIDCWGPLLYFGGKSVTNVMHAIRRFRNLKWLLTVKRLKSRVSNVAATLPSAWSYPFISYLSRAS